MKRTIVLAMMALAIPMAHATPDDTIAGLAKQSTRMLLIGEMHGTKEAPALVAKLADSIGKTGPVVVGLEWHAAQTGHEAYFASKGTAADRKRLLAQPFWSKAFQDGRASAAMLDLLEALRKQAHSGRPVTVAGFDQADGQDVAKRDEVMASNLRALAKAHPAARIVVLTGNYHARQAKGTPWDPAYRLMGDYLTDLAPVSVNVDAPRGAYWTCSGPAPSDCKAEDFGQHAKPGGRRGLYAAEAKLAALGYQQEVMLEKFTASLPARAGH